MSKQGKSVLVLGLITTFMGISLIFPGVICGDDGFYVIPVKKMHFSPVEKTGQTQSYGTGDDGDLERGMTWPKPRFKDNGDFTVTDNLTGLIWMKEANCFGQRTWTEALSDCNALADGSCGLTDGSAAGDWGLVNVKELQSLVHYGFVFPTLPNTAGTGQWAEGDPFTGVQSTYYWSSTTWALLTGNAWTVHFGHGQLYHGDKNVSYYVWCVRGGQ